jgi:N-acyl-L-homoserine lactone synthetase
MKTLKRRSDNMIEKIKVLAGSPSQTSSEYELGDAINQFFFSRYELVIANTDAEKEVSYKTRHSVYCKEMNYERENEHAIETDIYDERSINCFIKHIPTGECAGTIRLVLPTVSGVGLPLEDKFKDSILDHQKLPSTLAKEGICEMATSLCIRYGIKHAYVLMEPKLARRMKVFGFNFEPVGEKVDFNGTRMPYRIAPTSIVEQIATPLSAFYEAIDDNLLLSVNSIMPFLAKEPSKQDTCAA